MSHPVGSQRSMLGERLKRARERLDWSQSAVANAVEGRLGPTAQSYVARLEAGKITPTKEVLEAFAEALKVKFDWLVGAMLRDRYSQPGREEIAYPLEKGMLTLGELADWEAHPDHKELWLVAERYVDDHIREFGDAVSSFVRRGGTFVFFLPEGLEQAIDAYRDEIADQAAAANEDVKGRIDYVPLDLGQRALMAASFAIANPTQGGEDADGERYPNGYLILNDSDGEPCLGIKMSYQECRHRVGWLKTVRRLRSKAEE